MPAPGAVADTTQQVVGQADAAAGVTDGVTADVADAADGLGAPVAIPGLPADASAPPSDAAPGLAGLVPHASPEVAATAAAVGAASVGVGAAAAFAPGRRVLSSTLRWLLRSVGAVGLFSRIRPERVLEHATRSRILDAVAANPGITLLDLRERIGVAWGTLNHHVRKLEASGHLVSVRQGPRRLVFVAESPEGRAREELALLHVPTARRIAQAIHDRPGLRQTDLCEALQLNKPSASKHLSRFEAAGLILVERVGGACHYAPTPRLEAALQCADTTLCGPGHLGHSGQAGHGAEAAAGAMEASPGEPGLPPATAVAA